MSIHLTRGSVERLINGKVKTETQLKPLLHVLQASVAEVRGREHVLMKLTDGELMIRAFPFGDGVVDFVKNRTVGAGNVIQLLQFTTSVRARNSVVVGVTQLKVIKSISDVVDQPWLDDDDDAASVDSFVAATPDSGWEAFKPNVLEELKIFRDSINEAKRFARDTRTSKDGVRAIIRCFGWLVNWFNTLLNEIGDIDAVMPPIYDLSHDCSFDQLRLDAIDFISFFMKKIVRQLLKEIEITKTVPMLEAILADLRRSNYLVYRVTRDGFDCVVFEENQDEGVDWLGV